MTDLLPVKIRLGPVGKGAEISLNGMDLSRFIANFRIESEVGGPTRMQVEFVKIEADIEGPIDATGLGDWYRTYRLAEAVREGLQAAEGDQA